MIMTWDEAMAFELMPGVKLGTATAEQLEAYAELMDRMGTQLLAMSNAEFNKDRDLWVTYAERLAGWDEAYRVIKAELKRRRGLK